MIYCFGEVELDSENFCMQREGRPVSIEPQAFDLLYYLIQHKDRLVTRHELHENVWAGRVVSDATLSNHIKMARAAIGDDGEQQKLIKTLRGRGYQFVALLRESSPRGGGLQKLRLKRRLLPPWRARALFGFIVLITLCLIAVFVLRGSDEQSIKPLPSIAILPFENRSNQEKDEYFTEGIHHDLLMKVANMQGVKIISRTSVNLYRDSRKSIPDIANELGVAVILEGGVQRSGKEIRINVQLIDGLSDQSLWAESYTRPLSVDNVFIIQSEIANAIATSLSLVLTPSERDVISVPPTKNFAALDAYFIARASMRKNTNEGFTEASIHLRRALELDSKFALVYAVLAQLYLDQIYWSGSPVAQQLSLAQPLIQKALDLNPELSEAHSALASLREHQGEYEAAEASYLKAIKYRPSNENAYAALGRLQLWFQRNLKGSLSSFQKAMSLNPKDNSLKENLTQALIRNSLFDDARKTIKDILSDDPNFASAYRALSDIAAWDKKNLPQAQEHLRHALTLDPGVPTYALKLALRFLSLGEKELSLQWLNYSLGVAPSNNAASFTRGLIYELEGKMNEAFNAFLTVPKNSPLLSQSLYHILKIGLNLQFRERVENRFRLVYPQLWSDRPEVNERNYVSAYLISRLLIVKGDIAKATALLKKCLEFALKQPVGDWQGQHHDWLTKILISLDQKERAVQSFKRWVSDGNYSEEVLVNPIYKALAYDPEYQKALTIMTQSLIKGKSSLSYINGDNDKIWTP